MADAEYHGSEPRHGRNRPLHRLSARRRVNGYLSGGVQAFSEAKLKRLGIFTVHKRGDTGCAANGLGLRGFNLDLMPRCRIKRWKNILNDLRQAIAASPHLS